MITHFELKNRPFCRAFYKVPYFIKNAVLLLAMFCIMLPTYLVHYKGSDISVITVYRMIAGLNSKTFDYLLANQKSLIITQSIKDIRVQREPTVDFYMSCVSASRPCRLEGMAKTWPAY